MVAFTGTSSVEAVKADVQAGRIVLEEVVRSHQQAYIGMVAPK